MGRGILAGLCQQAPSPAHCLGAHLNGACAIFCRRQKGTFYPCCYATVVSLHGYACPSPEALDRLLPAFPGRACKRTGLLGAHRQLFLALAIPAS
jgi:hypothetical protein